MIEETSTLKFDWDLGNRDKNFKKHKLLYTQIEEVFFNTPLYLFLDEEHSQKEKRYLALGHDNLFNLIFVSFAVREGKIRVISARVMDKKEKQRYEKNI